VSTRFLKGDQLAGAAPGGHHPALAVGTDGAVRSLPDAGAGARYIGAVLDGLVLSIRKPAGTGTRRPVTSYTSMRSREPSWIPR
jgi:hypothetical protein